MKIAIIGTGSVGKACAMATIMRGCTEELVLVDINHELAQAVAIDMQYGAVFIPEMSTEEEQALQNGAQILKKSLIL